MTDPGPPVDEDGDASKPLPVGGGAGVPQERGGYPSYGLSSEDEEAFGRFYRACVPRLTAYLVHQGAPVDRAGEFVRDTMVGAYRQWRDIKSPASWAYQVAYQVFLRHVMRAEEGPGEGPEEKGPVEKGPVVSGLPHRPEAAEAGSRKRRGHGGALDRLSRFLDVDAGLREVRELARGPEDAVPGPGLAPDAEGGTADPGTADPGAAGPVEPPWPVEADVAETLRALPAERRLALRKDPVIAACVVGELLVRALVLVDDLARDAGGGHGERYVGLARDFARARTFDLDAVPTREVRAVLALASVFARALVHDLGRAALRRDHALEVAAALDEAARSGNADRVRGLERDARPLADAVALEAAHRLGLAAPEDLVLALLDGALDDFTDADLTAARPNDPALTGIHWSEGTKWPPGTDIEALRKRSAETAPFSRVYVLGRRPGGTGRSGTGVRS
ncbi:RNA polymerase sigma factor [Streptomyces sp. NPDC020489]|uniref:RNA polymerase sigma factor n=1 Tax=Streptomyces sp. NPDC020489 TaxID=3365077 RepID=UPI0037AB156A